LLTGEYGSGKTVLSRALEALLDSNKYKMVFITNPRIPAEEFLVSIAKQLGKEPLPERKVDLIDAIQEMLVRNVTIGRDTIVVIDEAQLIENKEAFEEIRMLMNYQEKDRFLLTLILMGQPELREKVYAIPSLKQRMEMRYHLTALNAGETKEYIDHRLSIAGGPGKIFQEEAQRLIYEYSKGLPREINIVCDMALLTGFTQKAPAVDRVIIQDIVKDFSGT
ncbi:MAG: AAA family ATPase, partial [Candidatus Omnitrophota bacterium]